MKKQIFILIALLISLGLNIFFGTMLLGREIGRGEIFRERPLKIVMEHMKSLPPEQRREAMDTLQAARPELRDAMTEMREARIAVFDYIKSPDYNRAEAEKRLADLRGKTTELQARAQTMMLDLADHLTPEQRAAFMNRKNGFQP